MMWLRNIDYSNLDDRGSHVLSGQLLPQTPSLFSLYYAR
jgi:hypothetical protein